MEVLGYTLPSRYCSVGICTAIILTAWLFSLIHIRPLGIFFITIYCFWYYKTKCHIRIVGPPELTNKIDAMKTMLQDLRDTKPGRFCMLISVCLAAFAVIGHVISGSALVVCGLILVAFLTTKYQFHIEPAIFRWTQKINRDNVTYSIAEFLPEEDEINMLVLERASDLSSIATSPTENTNVDNDDDDENSDEIPSELLIADLLPEIDESSTDEEDLLPLHNTKETLIERTKLRGAALQEASNSQYDQTAPAAGTSVASLFSTSASTASNAAMAFRKRHFKRDSSLSNTSSSSEESLSKGLQFPDHTTVDGSATTSSQQQSATDRLADASQMIASNQDVGEIVTTAFREGILAGRLVPNVMSNFVKWSKGSGDSATVGAGSPRNIVPDPSTFDVVDLHYSDPESDFEFVVAEDLQ